MEESEPQLEPPGAGLPPLRLAIARAMFEVVWPLMSDARAAAWYAGETRRILALARGLSEGQGTRRVLVGRLVGLEDSSRYWSPFMVLEHLRIVADRIADVVEGLAVGRPPAVEARVEDVKPARDTAAAVLAAYEHAATRYLERVAEPLAARSRTRYAHPWFGPMTAHEWHVLAALHQTIHRRQLEAILAAGQA